jgi:hypothetical protein
MHSVISVEREGRDRAIVSCPCAVENAGILAIAVNGNRVYTRLVAVVAVHSPVVSRTDIEIDSGFLRSPDTIQSVVVVCTSNTITSLNHGIEIGEGTASGKGNICRLRTSQKERVHIPSIQIIHAHTPTPKSLRKIAGRANSSPRGGRGRG